MNFAGNFNDSMPESQMTPGKREVGNNVDPVMKQSNDSVKKLKSSYRDKNQTLIPAEGSFGQQDYNSENFMGSACKTGNNSMSDRNSAPKMDETLRKLGHDAKMSVVKWMPLFGESEEFEACCAARLDEILKQALDLEQNLIEQKECLRARMKSVSRTLMASY